MINTSGRLSDSELQTLAAKISGEKSEKRQDGFSFNNIGPAPTFIQQLERLSQQDLTVDKEFFSGTCFKCARLATEEVCLKRCAGCQLVRYCSKDCQKTDWKKHIIMCKKFPVVKGKNVIARKIESHGCVTDPNKYREVIEEFERDIYVWMGAAAEHVGPDASRVMNYIIRVFRNARVCNICHEARPEMLSDCRCCVVSYCSKAHRIEDKRHCSHECNLLYGCAMANWYLTIHQQLQIPDGLLKEVNLNEGLSFEKLSKMTKFSSEKWLESIVNLVNENLAFPLTIYYTLNKFKLGEHRKTLSEITSLTIHIIHRQAMLDPRMWEFFLHQLPNLKELNLTFINGTLSLANKYNYCLPLECCSDCKRKQRVINYNIQPMHYHEYFSSEAYFQPDVVVVFNTEREFMTTIMDIEKAHHFASQRSITYPKHSIVILTEFSEERLKACVKCFKDARPIKVLLPVQKNPVFGFSTCRLNYIVYNFNQYVCCIKGKY